MALQHLIIYSDKFHTNLTQYGNIFALNLKIY